MQNLCHLSQILGLLLSREGNVQRNWQKQRKCTKRGLPDPNKHLACSVFSSKAATKCFYKVYKQSLRTICLYNIRGGSTGCLESAGLVNASFKTGAQLWSSQMSHDFSLISQDGCENKMELILSKLSWAPRRMYRIRKKGSSNVTGFEV